MIVITNPFLVENEIQIIHSLFDEGLSLLHIRKPDFTESQMALYIHQIKLRFRSKIALHSQHQLADDFGINRIHFSETERKKIIDFPVIEDMIFSTSSHSIEYFNALENIFEYALLSPVFTSISKQNYSPRADFFEDLPQRINFNSKMIALGGIHSDNIEETLRNGFDDVALLGTIWCNDNPIKQFKLCQKIVLSHLA